MADRIVTLAVLITACVCQPKIATLERPLESEPKGCNTQAALKEHHIQATTLKSYFHGNSCLSKSFKEESSSVASSSHTFPFLDSFPERNLKTSTSGQSSEHIDTCWGSISTESDNTTGPQHLLSYANSSNTAAGLVNHSSSTTSLETPSKSATRLVKSSPNFANLVRPSTSTVQETESRKAVGISDLLSHSLVPSRDPNTKDQSLSNLFNRSFSHCPVPEKSDFKEITSSSVGISPSVGASLVKAASLPSCTAVASDPSLHSSSPSSEDYTDSDEESTEWEPDLSCYCAWEVVMGATVVVTFLFVFLVIIMTSSDPLSGGWNGVGVSADPPLSFNYTIDSTCPHDIHFVFWVHTRPISYVKRQQIRESWGNARHLQRAYGMRSVLRFFVGLTNELETSLLHYESEKYEDIIQEGYIDSYHNLTYKALSGMRWVTDRCAIDKLTTILKADDDAAINVIRLLDYVNSTTPAKERHLQPIICQVVHRAKVMRKKTKWDVSKQDYPYKYYPTYCPGLAVLFYPPVLPLLRKQSEITPFFWIDDVYFTGLLTQPLGIKLRQAEELFSQLPRYDQPLPEWAYVVHVRKYSERLYRLFWLMTLSNSRASGVGPFIGHMDALGNGFGDYKSIDRFV